MVLEPIFLYSVISQVFVIGLTFGWIRTSINNLDRRVERIEHYIDNHPEGVVN